MSREEAIRIIKIVLAIAEDFEITVQGEEFTEEKCKEAVEIATKALEQEPKTGHWITKIKSDLRGDMWPTNPRCSECGGEPYYSNTIYNYKYCPYCGAKMVDEQEIYNAKYL